MIVHHVEMNHVSAGGDYVDDLFAIHSDPDSWRHFPLGRHTHRREAVHMVEQAEKQFSRDGLGYWSIRDRPGGPVVGRGGCAYAQAA